MYCQGSMDISKAAQARLAELGVVPPKNPYPQGGAFGSFKLPDEVAGEFRYKRGSPGVSSDLWLRSEARD